MKNLQKVTQKLKLSFLRVPYYVQCCMQCSFFLLSVCLRCRLSGEMNLYTSYPMSKLEVAYFYGTWCITLEQ